MPKPIKTMAELVRKVKKLVGKGHYFTVTCTFKTHFHGKKRSEEILWQIYHEHMDHYEGRTMDQVLHRFKEAWNRRKAECIPQDTPRELAAAEAGPGETK